MRYLISYNLREPAQKRGQLEAELENDLSGENILRSEWIVESNLTAPELFDQLKRHLKSDDRVLIVKVPGRIGTRINSEIVGFNLLSDVDIPNVSL